MSSKYLQNEKQNLLNAIGTELCWGWSPAVDLTTIVDSAACPHQQQQLLQSSASTTGKENSLNDKVSASLSKKEEDTDDLLDQLLKEIKQKPQCSTTETNIASSDVAAAESASVSSASPPEVNVLLVGAGDLRHVLPTMASLRVAAEKGEAIPVYHFYLYEPNLRVHCRHLFFVQWLLDSMFALEELEERVLMFLDVFGNVLLRDMSAAQFRNVAQRLIKSLEKESGDIVPLTSFEEMKYKEKDFIESQLRHWVSDASTGDVAAQWTQRVRQEMAERYDNRDNIVDWDFVFHLTEYTNLIKFPEYRTWRNTGIAYDVCHINPRKGFKYDYVHPNKSLCLFDKKGHGVFQGDVKSGPFFAFGTKTENERLCGRTTDGTCKYGNGIIAMHNIRAWLYALMVGNKWPWADHAFAWDDPANYNYLPPGTPTGVEFRSKLPKVKFHFIGLDFERFLLRQREGGPRFDVAFVGTSCTHLMSNDFFSTLMRPSGVVVAETAKFIVAAEDPAKEAYEQHILKSARAAGWDEDAGTTSKLHESQPRPRRQEGEPTAAQQTAQKRAAMHYQIALKRKEAATAGGA